jgi:hypothetical protein
VPSSAGAKRRLASASSSSSSNHINERPLRSRLGYSRRPFSHSSIGTSSINSQAQRLRLNFA